MSKKEIAPTWTCDICGHEEQSWSLKNNWETLSLSRIYESKKIETIGSKFHVCPSCLPFGKSWNTVDAIWKKLFNWFFDKVKNEQRTRK